MGSGALTMRQVVLIAGVAEVLGAVTLGKGVADTLTKKISYLHRDDCWDCDGGVGKLGLYSLGMASALASGGLFLLLATLYGMPVSTTHAIVGAVLGITILGTSARCVRWGWHGLANIVASWFVSPVFSGLVSGLLMVGINRLVLRAEAPFENACRALPLLFGFTVAVVLLMILGAADGLGFWPNAGIAAGTGLLLAALVHCAAVPRLRRAVEREVTAVPAAAAKAGPVAAVELSPTVSTRSLEAGEGDGGGGAAEKEEEGEGEGEGEDAGAAPVFEAQVVHLDVEGLVGDVEAEAAAEAEGEALLASGGGGGGGARALSGARAERLFLYLQVFTACLKSFAHGANDTANAAGPFAVVQQYYFANKAAAGFAMCDIATPFWVLLCAGLGIVLGLAVLGHKVIQTVGSDITKVNFTRGFAIELGSTLSVLLASFFGAPVSSTHCQIGSVLAIGVLEAGPKAVDWMSIGKIVVAWVVTVPFAAAVGAAIMWGIAAALEAARIGSR